MKGCILPFPKKGDLGLAKNYRGITLTSIAAKIYNALLRNCIEPKIDNILRKNKNGFRRNRSTTSQILTIRRILEGVRAKNVQATLLFFDFTKAFDSNQAETLLHILERAAAGIDLHVNAHKTEYMCYNQTGDISTLDGTSLKLVDKFTYLGSSVSSTEKDIDARLTKAWTAIDRL